MALDHAKQGKGVWKSGKGKGRVRPKGRALEDQAWDEVRALFLLLSQHIRPTCFKLGHRHLLVGRGVATSASAPPNSQALSPWHCG